MPEQQILIIEDDPIVAESISLAVKNLGFKVCGIALSYLEALEKLKVCSPDIAFVDINLNGEFYGLQIAEKIHREDVFPFIFLTAYADRQILDEAKRFHPAGYIVKPFDENDLLATIEIALYNYAQRQQMLHPRIDWKKINDQIRHPFSAREVEVLSSVIAGKTNQQIASDLFLSVATVKSHLARIYNKLDINSRTAAIAKLRELSRI